ncbi:MAG: hypothetical protein FWF57_05220 [Defluviitaleaceae bacterium]|nr:hypothetical protein [Defluviitaleaceae bacterium]
MKKLFDKACLGLYTEMQRFKNDQRGMELIQVILLILIVVIIAAALWAWLGPWIGEMIDQILNEQGTINSDNANWGN